MSKLSLNIVADENIPALEPLFSDLGTIKRVPGRELSAADVEDADVLLVRSVSQVNESLLEGSRVGFVGTATIGMDHIDRTYLSEKEIAFSSAPGCNADAVVEYVLTTLYMIAEKQGFELKDKTVGIVGVGNVGGRLQQRLEKLGCRLLLNDPPRAEQGMVELATVIEQADIICMHTPLTTEGVHATYHLLGSDEIDALKPGTIVINAGRGPAIDNDALKLRLVKRNDLTVVLDVWEHEPWIDAELADYVYQASPHIAGYTLDGKIRGTWMLAKALYQHLGLAFDRPLSDYLPPAAITRVEVSEQVTAVYLMNMLYDPWRDDRNLRATLVRPEQSQAFDLLRKRYPIRREFASMVVDCRSNPDIYPELQALGFSCDLESNDRSTRKL